MSGTLEETAEAGNLGGALSGASETRAQSWREAVMIEESHQMDIDALASFLTIAFRFHGHVGNVLTHISRANWERVEQALTTILSPYAKNERRLSPLEDNIAELLCADRGVSGRLARRYFEALLDAKLPADRAKLITEAVEARYWGQLKRADGGAEHEN